MNIEFLQSVALTLANERSLETILKRIVSGLAIAPEMALARIWLIRPGDICAECPSRSDCLDQTACLHLAASDGQSLDENESPWTCLEGSFRRFPLGVRKVGQVGVSGESILFTNIDTVDNWVRHPEWVKKEKIHSFAGQPLVFRGEILGVLGIFSRALLTRANLAMLRSFADHGAAAIANARAFEEVDKLRRQLQAENEYLREEVRTAYSSEKIIGHSPAIQKVFQQIEVVAPTQSNVLILGESGTGKELVAREIHSKSSRSEAPLIRVNCATIPAELFESEFFGHVKGSFTGAIRDRTGRFLAADGGTLFLDEVGEIPLKLQSKLLRVIQEGEFEAVGEDVTRSVNVRIIAATNRDLQREVREGRFREDLYYRLGVFPIELPPLRNRRQDIGLLARHFLERSAKKLTIDAPILKERHVKELQSYDWPGNVRELENAVERALITVQGSELDFRIGQGPLELTIDGSFPLEKVRDEVLTVQDLKALERDNILLALKLSEGKICGKAGAAALLNMKPTTLSSKIKALNIKRVQYA